MNARSAGSALLVALALVAVDATAKEPARGWADMPVGRFTTPPAKVPAHVRARESVRGLHVTVPSREAAVVVGEANGPSSDVRAIPASQCYAVHLPRLQEANDALDGEWSAQLGADATGYPRATNHIAAGTFVVHAERFVAGEGGAATLELLDSVVDPDTRGVRALAKSTFPLTLVHDPGFGVKIYAGRDERPDGKRFVQFVEVHPVDIRTPGTSGVVMNPLGGGTQEATDCMHARVAVPVRAGNGDGATMLTTVVLPPLGDGAPPRDDGAPARNEVRTRVVGVHVSVSQTAADETPVVSVSSWWNTRESTFRPFVVSE